MHAHQPPMPADKPLFRDPIHDGAADPTIIWNHIRGTWWMIYTNRRANVAGLKGVSWVHGTHLGYAESTDNGRTWKYRGVIQLPIGTPDDAHWAPEIIHADGHYHMFLSFVPGIHDDWSGTREMHQLISDDLIHWRHVQQIPLASNRVIDACVHRLPDGSWRLWYNNEADRKSIYTADSPDLFRWTDTGKAVGDLPGEGPYVWQWRGAYYMVVDIWKGCAIYRSMDANRWTRQRDAILTEPGHGPDDAVMGGHPMVVCSGDRAFLFYFTHPGRMPQNAGVDNTETRRSSIQVVELIEKNGIITCDRDAQCLVALKAPTP